MAAGHKDRLSPVDASFLVQEHEASHMHVGAIAIFEGPPPSYDEFIEGLESRLHLVPRYRQKLAEPRFEMGRPFWVDDPRFNIDYHVRHTALPNPGTLDQLRQLASGEVESVAVQSTYMHGQGLMVPVIGKLSAVPGEDGLPVHLLLEAEERHTS